ncbi:MAG: zinc-binding alcohol dehydrogenase family protein [Rhizonema sp. PD38]|nr:zinc-binding alcohol dehydrogenase family protein [Rhizonema sp. PD38]
MQSIRFEQFGSPCELHLQEIPTPQPGPDEVLVKVLAASINASDVKNVQGLMKHTTLPRTPGRDFAGVVEEGPANLVGVEVWGTGGDLGFTRDGTHAEYLLLPTFAVRPKPSILSMEQAASIGVTYVTAWMCVMQAAQTQAGETVLVIGATGGVGSAAMHIARWKGAHVIGTIRHAEDRAQIEQFNVDVADLSSHDLVEATKSLTNNRGADVIIDTVGGELAVKCLAALAPKGRLTEISVPPKQQQVSINLMDFYRRQLRLLGVNSLELNASDCAGILENLTPGFESKVLVAPDSIEKQALANAASAYESILKHSQGKIVLVPG